MTKIVIRNLRFEIRGGAPASSNWPDQIIPGADERRGLITCKRRLCRKGEKMMIFPGPRGSKGPGAAIYVKVAAKGGEVRQYRRADA